MYCYFKYYSMLCAREGHTLSIYNFILSLFVYFLLKNKTDEVISFVTLRTRVTLRTAFFFSK